MRQINWDMLLTLVVGGLLTFCVWWLLIRAFGVVMEWLR